VQTQACFGRSLFHPALDPDRYSDINADAIDRIVTRAVAAATNAARLKIPQTHAKSMILMSPTVIRSCWQIPFTHCECKREFFDLDSD
jgi:hypothetical protein